MLPLELTVKIFGLLNLGDLMKLRLVCKKFEWIVREVKIRELIVQKEYSRLDYELWFSTSDLKEPSMVLRPKYLLSGFSFSSGPFNFRFLRRLSIESFNDAKGIELDDINRFQHLEHLEIGFDQRPRKSSSMCSLFDKQPQKPLYPVPRLSLPNLKVLRIISFYNQKDIEIDAPRLKALELPNPSKYFKEIRKYVPYDPAILNTYRFKPNLLDFFCDNTNVIESLKIKHPGSIKFVSGFCLDEYFKNRILFKNFFRRFRNVEHLHVNNTYNLFKLTHDLTKILPIFKKLKKVDLGNGYFLSVNLSGIAYFVNWAASLSELKVYFMGIQLSNNPNVIDDFHFYQQAIQEAKEAI